MAASKEEWRAIEGRDDYNCKRSARLEAEDFLVSSIVTSAIPKVRSAGMVSVVVAGLCSAMLGCYFQACWLHARLNWRGSRGPQLVSKAVKL